MSNDGIVQNGAALEAKDIQSTPAELKPIRVKTVRDAQPATQPVISEVIDRKDLNYQWRRDKELVRGRFVNDETPGEAKEFAFRKYKQDPIKTYRLKDNGIYEIPLGVAKHLNEDCKTPIYGQAKDEDGNHIEVKVGYKSRVHFESLDFSGIDDSDFNSRRDIPGIKSIT